MPGNVGITEIAVVLVIVLIIFGPKRLPELGRSLGRGIREFRGSISGDADDDDSAEATPLPPGEKVDATAAPADEKTGERQGGA